MRHVALRPDGFRSKPLSEPVFLILASLANQPRHGYALMKDIGQLSGVRLSTGTLYGALRRMLEDTWIEVFKQADTSRDKQAYRLTAAGRQRLELELEQRTKVNRAATARLRSKEVLP
jgi:DNA-binding PadR family transcriptional regulator